MDKKDKLTEWNDDEKTDRNKNGISDDIEPPNPDIAAGSAKLHDRLRDDPLADPVVSGGDLDTQIEGAQFSGDESAGSSMPSPEQNAVDDIGSAMGVTYEEGEPLNVGEKERERDKKRWELDPASSEDYKERLRGNE